MCMNNQVSDTDSVEPLDNAFYVERLYTVYIYIYIYIYGAAVYQWCEFKSRRGRTKIYQLKDLILTLFGLIFRRIYIYIYCIYSQASPCCHLC